MPSSSWSWSYSFSPWSTPYPAAIWPGERPVPGLATAANTMRRSGDDQNGCIMPERRRRAKRIPPSLPPSSSAVQSRAPIDFRRSTDAPAADLVLPADLPRGNRTLRARFWQRRELEFSRETAQRAREKRDFCDSGSGAFVCRAAAQRGDTISTTAMPPATARVIQTKTIGVHWQLPMFPEELWGGGGRN